jgi:hypothetical protein
MDDTQVDYDFDPRRGRPDALELKTKELPALGSRIETGSASKPDVEAEIVVRQRGMHSVEGSDRTVETVRRGP